MFVSVMHVMRYPDVMRTTVSIEDHLLNHAKSRARERGQTLGEFIEGSLRRELAAREGQPAAPEVPIFNGGTPPSSDIDLRSGREIAELFTDEDAARAGTQPR